MLETSGILRFAACLALAGCAVVPPPVAEQPPAPVPAAPAPSVAVAPPVPVISPEVALAEEARALLSQAETDVQRARARRALWLGAWEGLVASRNAMAAKQHSLAIGHAKRASELARLGLAQLAYPEVK